MYGILARFKTIRRLASFEHATDLRLEKCVTFAQCHHSNDIKHRHTSDGPLCNRHVEDFDARRMATTTTVTSSIHSGFHARWKRVTRICYVHHSTGHVDPDTLH